MQTATPCSVARASASSSSGVGRPAPVPALTIPFAPAATAASIMAPSAPTYDVTTSTRGRSDRPRTSNSVAVVWGRAGVW